MPAQVKTVQHARKPQGNCRNCGDPIPVGAPYRYFKPGFRSRVKVQVCMKPECTPRRSQLDTSKMSDAYAAIEDAEKSVAEATTVEDVREALDTLASAIRDLAGEYEDSVSEHPMLEEQLTEKIDMLNQFADDIEGVEIDDPPDEPEAPDEPDEGQYDDHDEYLGDLEAFEQEQSEYEDAMKEYEDALPEAIENAKSAATDAIGAAEF